jgi:hypothetical protein
MLHHIAIELAVSNLFGVAQLFAGPSASGQTVDSPRRAGPRKPTSDFIILRKTAEQARIQGMIPDIWGEDDYSVIDGETCVGRIYRERILREWRWLWFLQAHPALPQNSGVTGSLEEAEAEFKRRYAEVRSRTSLDSWWR